MLRPDANSKARGGVSRRAGVARIGTRPIEENDAMDTTTTTRAPLRFATDAQRWAAIGRRTAGADGIFCYAVRTTGIYCRPSCGARRPLRKNVRFFDTEAAGGGAGFGACKR